MSLSQLLSSHRVVVCVGCGGVGKTTTAASLAVQAAMDGRRVLCLTIDPAKRLANSLGLEAMTTEEQVVPSELFEARGLAHAGQPLGDDARHEAHLRRAGAPLCVEPRGRRSASSTTASTST